MPIHAPRCPSCIYAIRRRRLSRLVTTGLSPQIRHRLLRNRRVKRPDWLVVAAEWGTIKVGADGRLPACNGEALHHASILLLHLAPVQGAPGEQAISESVDLGESAMSNYSYANILKRHAKSLARDESIPLAAAHERVAMAAGFAHYHELNAVAKRNPDDPADEGSSGCYRSQGRSL